MPATCRSRAPIAFMIPTWRTCWPMITDTVFATRNPAISRLRSPIPPRTTNTAASSSLAGCLPGSGTSEKATGTPAFSIRSRTSSAMADASATVAAGLSRRMRTSLNESSQPRSSSVSNVT